MENIGVFGPVLTLKPEGEQLAPIKLGIGALGFLTVGLSYWNNAAHLQRWLPTSIAIATGADLLGSVLYRSFPGLADRAHMQPFFRCGSLALLISSFLMPIDLPTRLGALILVTAAVGGNYIRAYWQP
ncbi:MAG: hypothetical protein AB7F31_01725 [Parachlamydiales bacterium]